MRISKRFLKRVMAVSTYVILFCIIGNIVVPAMIVQSVQAQSFSNSSIIQPKVSIADQKILDKARADSKVAREKELGLTTAEIRFTEDFDLDKINQKVDTYVKYDAKGMASFNASAYMHDPSIKLSKSNTNISISIANKMIAKYNSDLGKIVTTTTKARQITSANTQIQVPELITEKKIIDRGYEITVSASESNKLSTKASNATMSTSSSSCLLLPKFKIVHVWSDQDAILLVITPCIIEWITDMSAGTSIVAGLLTAGICALITGGICAAAALIVGSYIALNIWWLGYYNKWYCGSRGVMLIEKINYYYIWVWRQSYISYTGYSCPTF